MTEKRFNPYKHEIERLKTQNQDLLETNAKIRIENEQLKTLLQNTSVQRDEFHRGARENANRVGKLEKENEQLKKELEDALLDVKIYKNANATFDNVYQENEKLNSRIEYLERKIERERNATDKQYEKWEKEALEKINKLEK